MLYIDRSETRALMRHTRKYYDILKTTQHSRARESKLLKIGSQTHRGKQTLIKLTQSMRWSSLMCHSMNEKQKLNLVNGTNLWTLTDRKSLAFI